MTSSPNVEPSSCQEDGTPELLGQRGILATGFLTLTWLVYIGYLLLSDLPPGDSLLHLSVGTLKEALALSLNFWFVTPLLLPAVAPPLNPVLEGIFNIVVAWALLFWGFLLDGRGQRWPMAPFLVGMALLTNVFYLPWLALRRPNPLPTKPPLSRLETFAESKALPLALAGIFLASVLWGVWGRPDITHRWAAFLTLLESDRLAYSFVVDMVFFALFQGWLVKDDMARRQWNHPVALWTARLLPFWGLVIYFLWRPKIGQLKSRANSTPVDGITAPW
jgi:hypothetical protein